MASSEAHICAKTCPGAHPCAESSFYSPFFAETYPEAISCGYFFQKLFLVQKIAFCKINSCGSPFFAKTCPGAIYIVPAQLFCVQITATGKVFVQIAFCAFRCVYRHWLKLSSRQKLNNCYTSELSDVNFQCWF